MEDDSWDDPPPPKRQNSNPSTGGGGGGSSGGGDQNPNQTPTKSITGGGGGASNTHTTPVKSYGADSISVAEFVEPFAITLRAADQKQSRSDALPPTYRVDANGSGSGVHLLPAQISFSGPAKITTYFKPHQKGKPIATGTDSGSGSGSGSGGGESMVWESALRGRKLTGHQIALPTGSVGLVFHDNGHIRIPQTTATANANANTNSNSNGGGNKQQTKPSAAAAQQFVMQRNWQVSQCVSPSVCLSVQAVQSVRATN